MKQAPEHLLELIEPVVEGLGFECVGVEYSSHPKNGFLRIYIDSENGVQVEDCTRISHQVSGVLDVEDPITGEYNLEVSSPGMDRPIFTVEQFNRYVGEFVDVKLRYAFEGRRKFKGKLVAIEDGEDIVVHIDNHEYILPIDAIDKANLIFQDHKNK